MSIFLADCAAVCAYPHQSSKNAHMQTTKGLKCAREKSLAQDKLSTSGYKPGQQLVFYLNGERTEKVDTKEETVENTDIEKQKRVTSVCNYKGDQRSSSCIPRVAENKIRKTQRNDQVLAPVMDSTYKQKSKEAVELVISYGRTGRCLHRKTEFYIIVGNQMTVLRQHYSLFLKILISVALDLLRSNPTCGHGYFGVTMTVEKIRRRVYWSGLRQDVETWCRTSETQEHRYSQVTLDIQAKGLQWTL